MNYKTTIALIVLLLLVGAYFFFVERNAPTSYPGDVHTPAVLSDGSALFAEDQLSSDKIDHVTIERGQLKLAFAKEGEDWYQVEPVRCKLNNWSMTSLIGDAAGLRQFDTLPADSDPGFFATVTFSETGSEQKPIVLHLGELTIGGRARLRQGDDGPLLLTNDALQKQVRDLKINDWRSKSLTAPGPTQVETFTIQNQELPGAGVTIRRDQTQWHLDAAGAQRVATDKAEQLINAFGRLYVDQFIADRTEDLAAFGLDKPRRVITLTTADRTVPATDDQPEKIEPGEHITLSVGRAADLENKTFFAARREGDSPATIVFTLRADDLKAFDKTADDLRDPKLLSIAAGDVKSLSLIQGDRSLKLQRDENARYVFADPKPNFAADYSEASDLVDKVVNLQADGFDAAYEPQTDPVLRLIVNDSVASIYAGEADTFMAVHEGEPVAFKLPPELVKPLLDADALSLRERTIFDLKADQIKSLTLTQSDSLELKFDHGEDNTWTLKGFDQFEQSALDELLAALAPLRCERWPPPEVKLGEQQTSLVIETREGSTHTLTAGADLATSGTADAPFAIADSLRQKLNAEFRPRLVIDLTPDQIESVAVTREGKTITVRHEEYQYVADDLALDQEAAAGLFDTLAGLSARRFVAAPAEQPPITLTIQPKTSDAITLKLSGDGKLALRVPGAGDYRDSFSVDDEAAGKLIAALVNEKPAEDEAVIETTK
ncbi:MAG: DUF4340 domain-containing protein [Phycisphaeraceae bacterium]|nr:DUF4340 domain-containing protein [Phycisphaeraceae bacterium]